MLREKRTFWRKLLSLPSWERGLKSAMNNAMKEAAKSLPSWERGLKFLIMLVLFLAEQSLPSWERGLKFPIKWDIFVDIPVAPLVGAWIEITRRVFASTDTMSLPSWERGLK